MNEMQTMDYILSIIVLGYGLYLTIQNIRMFIANQKARRDYLAQTKNQYQMVNQYYPFAALFAVLSLAGIVTAIMADKTTKNDVYTCLALIVISLVAFGMVLVSVVKRRAIVDKNGFVYEDTYHRYRSVLSMEPKKSMFKNIDILTAQKEHIIVTKKMGDVLKAGFQEWKHRKTKDNI